MASVSLVSTIPTSSLSDDVFVSGQYAYIADYGAGLRIFDVSNPTNPIAISTIGTPSGVALSVRVEGAHAIVGSINGVDIFDVSNPNSPVLITSYEDNPFDYAIAASGTLLLSAGFDGQLHVRDISNPSAPVELSLVSLGDGLYHITIVNNLAVIADQDSGDGTGSIHLVDISDPRHPTQVSSYSLAGSSAPSGTAVSGNVLFVADQTRGFYSIDISNPTLPTLIGSYDLHPESAGAVYFDVQVSGSYAYVAEEQGANSELLVLDVSDPAIPKLFDSIQLANDPRNVFISGQNVYVADDLGGVEIFTIAAPSNHPPTASAISGDVNEDGTVVLLGNSSDQDAGDQLAFAIEPSATKGRVVDNHDGTFTYDPNEKFEWLGVGETATDSFNYTVTDSHGASSTALATITIQGENDKPVATGTTAGTLHEHQGLTASSSIDSTSGTLSFTDLDLDDRPVGSISSTRIEGAWDAGGKSMQLTLEQAAVLKAGFQIQPEANNTNDGLIDWTYSVADKDIDFLQIGQTVTVSARIEVSDGNGGTADQNVSVTIAGTPEPITNKVFPNETSAGEGEIAVEMVKLAVDAYPSVGFHQATPLQAAPNLRAVVDWATVGLHPLTADELGIASFGHQGSIDYSFTGGAYQAIDNQDETAGDPSEANAIVSVGRINGKSTLLVSFAGTDQMSDWADYAHFSDHYAKFAPLIDAIHKYVDADGVEQVFVSGHSLGAAMVQDFVEDPVLNADPQFHFQAWTIGSPGSDNVQSTSASSEDSRIVNFIHPLDPVAAVPSVSQALSHPSSTDKTSLMLPLMSLILASTQSIDAPAALVLAAEILSFGAPKTRAGDPTILVGANSAHSHDGDVYVADVEAKFGGPLECKLTDGPIAGAVVFCDSNENGILDPGEVSTTTRQDGSFTVSGGTGPLVAFGGSDTSTGLPLLGHLLAPSGSHIVSPLTTLLMGQQDQTQLLNAFHLSSTVDLTSFDPISAMNDGDPAASPVFIAGAQVYETVNALAMALIKAGADDPSSASSMVFDAISETIGDQKFDLGDAETIRALLAKSAQAGGVTIAPAQYEAVASVVSGSNQSLAQLIDSDQPGGQLLTNAATIQVHTQQTIPLALNRPPIVIGVVDLGPIIEDGGGRLITQADLIANASDPDGQVLRATSLAIVSGQGELVDNHDGTWSYSPARNDHSPVTFAYQVTDGLISVADTAILEIQPLPHAPLAQDGSASGNEDTTIGGAAVATDADNTQAQLTYSLVGTNGGAAHGAVSMDTHGAFIYTPAANFNGADSFTYKVNDGSLDSNVATVSLTINPVNDAPVIVSDGGSDTANVSVVERTTAVTTVVATDIDSPTLTYSIVGGTDASKFQIDSSTGALSFITAPNFDVAADADHNNSYIVQVRASDGSLTDDQTSRVNVINDPNITSTVHWTKSVDVSPHPAGWQPAGIGDFNGDGTSDLAWFNASNGDLEIWKLANGQWAGSSDLGLHPAGYQPVLLGDYNGDHTNDVLWFNPTTNDVDLWKISDSQWAGSVDIGTHPAGYQPALTGDFNGDGTSDIAWYNSTTNDIDLWKILNGQWAGSSHLGSHPAGYVPLLAGDFNGDGTSDIAWYNPSTRDLDLWLIKNGQWAGSVDAGSHPDGWQPLAATDFTQDGTSDIAWYNSTTNDIDLWKILNGQWSASFGIGEHPLSVRPVGIGDVDHNGVADIMWRQVSTGHIDSWLLAFT